MGDFKEAPAPRASSPDVLLERGRSAFARAEWASAYEHLAAVAPQDPDDLERLATAAYLAGREAESEELRARLHQALLQRGEKPRAARVAFWLASALYSAGERARAGGWLARAHAVLEGAGDCVERGYLLLPEGLRQIAAGDARAASLAFSRAAEIGIRHDDPDLCALACHSRGRALIRMGDVAAGVVRLDEAMAAAEAGALSPLVVGEVYCSVIEGCLEIFDLRRAQEWTDALTRWCNAQPELVPFRGECLVRRAEVLQLHGAWPDAADSARSACERLGAGHGRPAAGAAFYQRAELLRVRGELARAEEAYREAGRWRGSLQPGLALLRLAQGHTGEAFDGIRRALDEASADHVRARLLPAAVEIFLAAGDVAAAHTAADKLADGAERLDAPLLRAHAAQARGAVLLAEGNASGARAVLQEAWTAWQQLAAPYEAARTGELMAHACDALGDHEAADVHRTGAQSTYRQLGAALDLARLEPQAGAVPVHARPLTGRELEVLRHLAQGKTNRSIAAELVISERTVDRHVSNILGKLGLSSRTAAAAYVWQHGLL